MSTKGASNRYGNTKGSINKGKPTKHINFQWAKDFNRGGIKRHFRDHGKEFNAVTQKEYVSKALHFANKIDRKNFKSVVDYKGTTFKYDIRDGKLVIVTKDGYIVSYHHTGKRFRYSPIKGKEVWIWI